MDKRKNNKGTKGNKGGRPSKLPITNTIREHCEVFILELLKNKEFKKECQLELFKYDDRIKDVSFIYLIKTNDLFKIGITSNIKNRFKQYQSHSGYISELIYTSKLKNANYLEKKLIHKYDKYRTKGDWFFLDKENVINIIKDITNHIYG
tara:strand:+ start:242 stop:691 length:450 start_codon:yes stop_codon:yes gene_type:complete